jgi:RNA polymerase sigma-70 factor, ECF subfamily
LGSNADLEDVVQEVFLLATTSIRKEGLRDPSRLPGFIRTLALRVAMSWKRKASRTVSEYAFEDVPTPANTQEQNLLTEEKVSIMVDALRQLSARDCEVLSRFYLQEQSMERVCQEMNLTETQFRLLKSRAKQRYASMAQAVVRGSLRRHMASARPPATPIEVAV